MTKPDPNHAADARAEAVRVMTDALHGGLAPYRWVAAAILPRPWLERIARRQLSALLALPAPTRAALLGEPR